MPASESLQGPWGQLGDLSVCLGQWQRTESGDPSPTPLCVQGGKGRPGGEVVRGAPNPATCCVPGAVWKGRTGQLGEVEGLTPAPSLLPPGPREADVLLSLSTHRSALERFTRGQELCLHLSVEVTEA